MSQELIDLYATQIVWDLRIATEDARVLQAIR